MYALIVQKIERIVINIARGTIAKQVITNKLQEAFGADFLGEVEKKIYLQAPENGEMVQIAISMTCPKTAISVNNAPVIKNGMMDFENSEPVVVNKPAVVETTEEERDNILEMMRKLGL